MAATIADVARAAGVSTASVSRSLRGQPGVSETTRARVQEVARQLGYVMSPAASSLATGRTNSVAVIVPFIDRWFFGKAISGAEEVFRTSGIDLLLYNLGGPAGRARFFACPPLDKRVDAVLILCLPLTEREIGVLGTLGVPVGLIGARVEPFIDVRIDDLAGAMSGVQHLINLGHQRIGLISGLPDEPMHFTAPRDRRNGYRRALRAAGLPDDDALEVHGDFTIEGGAAAMAELLARPDPPSAVFAESDEMAFGAMRTARKAGLEIPGDLSVVGFDDHDTAELVDLTTVAQPVRAQGQRIAELLLDAIKDPGAPRTGDRTMPTRLIVRGSTSPPGRRIPGPPQPRGDGLYLGRGPGGLQ